MSAGPGDRAEWLATSELQGPAFATRRDPRASADPVRRGRAGGGAQPAGAGSGLAGVRRRPPRALRRRRSLPGRRGRARRLAGGGVRRGSAVSRSRRPSPSSLMTRCSTIRRLRSRCAPRPCSSARWDPAAPRRRGGSACARPASATPSSPVSPARSASTWARGPRWRPPCPSWGDRRRAQRPGGRPADRRRRLDPRGAGLAKCTRAVRLRVSCSPPGAGAGSATASSSWPISADGRCFSGRSMPSARCRSWDRRRGPRRPCRGVAERIRFGRAQTVVCPDWASGQAASLRCGLAALAGAGKVMRHARRHAAGHAGGDRPVRRRAAPHTRHLRRAARPSGRVGRRRDDDPDVAERRPRRPGPAPRGPGDRGGALMLRTRRRYP